MAPLDQVTITEATIAALALGLGGNMLKPEAKGWATSRTASLTMLALSITMAGLAIDVWFRQAATPREAVTAASMAAGGVALLIHLWRQRVPPRA